MTKSKVNFKYPTGVEARCKVTGFKGTIVVRAEAINGAITYGLQPRQKKEDSDYVADAKCIDEDDIQLLDKDYNDGKSKIVEFKFECGQPVKNFINEFEGVITRRKQWKNGCIQYVVEGKMLKNDLYGMTSLTNTYWEQELEAQKDKKTKKVAGKKRSGGPSEGFTAVETIKRDEI